MAIALNPIFPVVSSKPVLSDIVLQPGAVVDAQVLKVLENNFVRIAIASLSIDVLSEVPLRTGQTLQLAVSQTPQGIRLAVVPQGGGAPALDDLVATGAARPLVAAANTPVLNDAQALAVSAAVQTAASRQSGLSQLFANLSAALGKDVLPPQVKQAVAQLFALQPELTENLTGAKIQAAFEASGLFREKTLSSAATQAQPQTVATPDLKSALIVLRQTLSIALNAANTASTPNTAQASPGQANSAPAATPARVSPQAAQSAAAVFALSSVTPQQASPSAASLPQQILGDVAPPLAPELEPPDLLIQPLGSAPVETIRTAAVFTNGAGVNRAVPIGTDAFLSLIQNALQIGRAETASPPGHTTAQLAPDSDPGIARTNVPPPPFRGATPAAQAIAVATIAPDAPAAATVRHLIDDTDSAIARQTLLQVASLPDRVDTQQGTKPDQTLPRWSFEIPFVTPQGTAVAQFEVARDGGNGSEGEAAKKVWRARFSLDVEPAGPVHAIISLAGETASVRMWAERAVTAAQLRANTAQLAQALRVAALEPGDIVVGEGEPPHAATAPAGHFVNRAS